MCPPIGKLHELQEGESPPVAPLLLSAVRALRGRSAPASGKGGGKGGNNNPSGRDSARNHAQDRNCNRGRNDNRDQQDKRPYGQQDVKVEDKAGGASGGRPYKKR